jgi:sorting nexin-4
MNTSELFGELGASYNGWSLTETDLADAIEQIGQAIDTSMTATNVLYTSLEENFGDILLEYEKFSSVIQDKLLVRHQLHYDFEQISENLILKQQNIARLENNEHEAQRLAAALAIEGQPPIPIPRPSGFIASINAIIDNNPDATRRNTISKTKEKIHFLEKSREETRIELLKLNNLIQTELERFQQQKIKDLKNGLLSFSIVNREYHQRCLDAWEGTRDSIERINSNT